MIKLVKTYRFTTAIDQRRRLTEEIFRQLEPKMRAFIYGSVAPGSAPDVLQEALIAIATGLKRFEGGTTAEFWAWAYRIARNKRADHFRRKASDRLHPMAEADMRQLLDASGASAPVTRGERIDLDYALKLLASVKPDCRELLRAHYIQGLDYPEIAAEQEVTYDAARMKVTRCLNDARALVA